MTDATLWACQVCRTVIAPERLYGDPNADKTDCPSCAATARWVQLGGVSR